jgi:hypothetical protein
MALLSLCLTTSLVVSAADAAQSSISDTGATTPLGKPDITTEQDSTGGTKPRTTQPSGSQQISVPPSSTTVLPSGPYTHSANWRPVSGYTGDQSVYYSLAGSTYALNRLEFYEHSDDPNHIGIWMEQLCHDQPCDPGPRDGELHVGTKEENLSTRAIIAAGDNHYITEIQVCTTDENDIRNRKIKGARIWTARLDPGGVVNRTGF